MSSNKQEARTRQNEKKKPPESKFREALFDV